jgi:ABC transport system ATP-binding/permease protein
MALISMQEVSIGFGGPPLLDSVNLQIERGEMVGLLGRNGVGQVDAAQAGLWRSQPGEWCDGTRQQNLRLAYLPQEVPQDLPGSVHEIIAGGLEQLSGSRSPCGSSSFKLNRLFLACSLIHRRATRRCRLE